MKKLIKIKLNKNELESVQYIANTNSNEVLIPKSELGLFNEFIIGNDKNLVTNVDYVLFSR